MVTVSISERSEEKWPVRYDEQKGAGHEENGGGPFVMEGPQLFNSPVGAL